MKVIEIVDYLSCPLRYRYLYREKLEELPSPYSRFTETARIIMIHFFYYTMNGIFPTLSALKECFERIWYQDEPDIREKLMWRDNNLIRTLENKSFDGILKFYNKETSRSFRTVMIDQHYKVPIGDHVLEGKIDIIRDIGKKVELISIRPSSPYTINFDIDMSAASYAFRHLYGVKEDMLTAYFFPGCREVNTKRQRDNYRGLVGLMDYLAGDPAFYPRYSNDCHKCGFKDNCMYWGGIK